MGRRDVPAPGRLALRPQRCRFGLPRAADELALLAPRWAVFGCLPRKVRFVTFSAKRFDCDWLRWLRVRSAAHRLRPSRRDVLGTYPTTRDGEADVRATLDGYVHLADLL